MEAVCHGKMWDVALAYDGDKLLGAMPYHYVKRYGMTVVLQPQLTQFSGPVYFYDTQVYGNSSESPSTVSVMSESHRLEFEKRVATMLLSQLEKLNPSAVLMHTSPQITNWLPFYWNGYKQTTRYTYRIPDISDPDAVFASFDKRERRRKIAKMENSTKVSFDMSPRDFADFHRRYWESRGEKDLLSSDIIVRVCTAAIERGQGVVASLHGEDGALLAARFVVFDKQEAHTLLSANEPTLHRSGHSEMLIWLVIKYLSDKTRAFDFEGSMDEGIEYFYRSFGASQTPFFALSKFRNILVEFLFRIKKP